MYLRVVASLLFFAGFAAAGIDAPNCSTEWGWSFNSLGQNPCKVAAYMLSTCSGGSFTIDALPSGAYYTGTSAAENSDLCYCNTVTYSLLSACDACQGADWLTYKSFVTNCTKVLANPDFPNPVPSGTAVPLWALIDVTIEGTWDPVVAATIGDSPESGPGTKL